MQINQILIIEKNIPSHLSNLKLIVNKIDNVQSKTTPVDLSKLSDVVKNEVAKYNE